jgi:pyruvate,water dikinase
MAHDTAPRVVPTGDSAPFVVRRGDALAPAALVGGKGRNLAVLANHGIPVPPWIVVTVNAFDRLLAAHRTEIDRVAEEKAPADAAAQIQARVLGATFDAELAREIVDAARSLVATRADARVAVRSSAIDEDGADHSFAGQLDSYLFQRADDSLLDAVKRCFASAFNERALVYRRKMGLPVSGIRAAAVVQEMIDADVSGVTFTANPTNGHPEQQLVNAVFGLGEGLVSGELDCDSWVLDAEGRVVEEQLREKERLVRFDVARGEGTLTADLEPAKKSAPSLDEHDLRTLFRTCRRIEQDVYGGAPQDVEWCIRGGALFIVQARPIAQFARLKKRGAPVVFDNSNVVESYAGVPTPLTYSFASQSFRATFRGTLVRLGLPKFMVRELEPLFRNMLGYVDGRMYYNLLNWYRWFEQMPHGGDNVAEFDRLIGISRATRVGAYAGTTDAAARLRTLVRRFLGLRMTQKTMMVERIAREFFERFERNNGKYTGDHFHGRENTELLAIYREVFESCSPDWDAEIVNFIGAQRAFAELSAALAELSLSDATTTENDLVGGDGGIASMRPTREMSAIAATIRAEPAWRAHFEKETPEALARAVLEEKDATFTPLRRRVETFIADYGCRCMNELKLEEPTLHEDATVLFSTLKGYVLKPPPSFDEQLARQVAARNAAESLVYGKLGPLGRLRLRRIIARTRRHIYLREELRLIRGKYWGIVRRAFRQMGRNFVRDGVLDDFMDVFFLKVDEIAELIEGRSPDAPHVRDIVALRKRARDEQLTRPAPTRIFSYGDVCVSNFAVPSVAAAGGKKGSQASDDGSLTGIACGPGTTKGPARVVLGPKDLVGLDGQVLVAERTDPGWIPLYPSISALVIERGSVLSHSAVVAREMGIPTVVGVKDATRHIRSGDIVTVDGSAGRVVVGEARASGASEEAAPP